MSDEANDFKIGLFLLAALTLLAAGLLTFGGAQYFQPTVTEVTYVAGNANGLEVGAPVTLRGVRVGRVTRIDFTWDARSNPGYVRIQFAVLARTYPVQGKALAKLIQTQVNQGLRARVETQGLIGSPLVALEYVNPIQYPPLPLPRAPLHPYVPSAPSQLNQLLSSMEQSLRRLSQFDLEKLSAALDSDLLAADRLLNHMDEVKFGQLGTNVDGLVTQLRAVGTNLQLAINDFKCEAKRMDLGQLSQNANTLILQLQAATHQMEGVLLNLDTRSLNESLASVRQASAELEQALRELKQYPSGFLFGGPPPRAKSVAPIH